jgi:hypothetical protein
LFKAWNDGLEKMVLGDTGAFEEEEKFDRRVNHTKIKKGERE